MKQKNTNDLPCNSYRLAVVSVVIVMYWSREWNWNLLIFGSKFTSTWRLCCHWLPLILKRSDSHVFVNDSLFSINEEETWVPKNGRQESWWLRVSLLHLSKATALLCRCPKNFLALSSGPTMGSISERWELSRRSHDLLLMSVSSNSGPLIWRSLLNGFANLDTFGDKH